MKLSDSIANMILEMLEQCDGMAQIQRNELADRIGCVPSQINYVITSRFTPEQGYIVESRRGGGGYIRISRAKMSEESAIMHIVNSVGAVIDENSVRNILKTMCHEEIIKTKVAVLILSALCDNSYKEIPPMVRDRVRAIQFKQMLLASLEI